MKKRNTGHQPILRILDANHNRVKEALRVAEDIARFILEDKRLASEFKRCRHESSRAFLNSNFSYLKLLAQRDAKTDVGKAGAIRDKKGILRWQDIMASNLKRAQEGLRVLEECSKLVSEKLAANFQRLRFDIYDLEKRSIFKF